MSADNPVKADEADKESDSDPDYNNSITIGEIQLTSSATPVDVLIGYMICILEDPVIKGYLENLASRKLLGISKSYVS